MNSSPRGLSSPHDGPRGEISTALAPPDDHPRFSSVFAVLAAPENGPRTEFSSVLAAPAAPDNGPRKEFSTAPVRAADL
jgi:hypothetical protein